jgi:hypothetical protein
MYNSGSTIAPLTTAGALAATGLNTTVGIVIGSIALLLGAGLFVRSRLLKRHHPDH